MEHLRAPRQTVIPSESAQLFPRPVHEVTRCRWGLLGHRRWSCGIHFFDVCWVVWNTGSDAEDRNRKPNQENEKTKVLGTLRWPVGVWADATHGINNPLLQSYAALLILPHHPFLVKINFTCKPRKFLGEFTIYAPRGIRGWQDYFVQFPLKPLEIPVSKFGFSVPWYSIRRNPASFLRVIPFPPRFEARLRA